MEQSYGSTDFEPGQGRFASRLRISEGPLEVSWHHCSLTSDFIGDFYAAVSGAGSEAGSNERRHSIGYLVNELLENAVKFRAPGDIEIETLLSDGGFGLRVANNVAADVAARFADGLAELTKRDPGDLLIERIERNAEDPESSGSGLGLLTLMSDYDVRLGWTFQRTEPDGPVRLETIAALPLS